MIFRTITDEATGANKSIGLFGKTLNGFKGIINSFKQNGFVSTLLNTPLINIDTDAIDVYNDQIKSSIPFEQALATARRTTNAETIALIESSNGLEVQTERVTAAQKASTIAAKAQSVALRAASTALNIAASIGIGMLINLGTSLLQAGWEKIQETLKSTDEKIKELTQDLNSSLQEIQSISKEFQNLKSSADEVIPKFAKLSEGVDKFGNNISLTDEEYKEFLDLNNKIADMFPELNVGLDSNGNAMLALSGNADTLTESLYALLEVQRQVANQEIADGFNDAFENTKNLVGAYKDKKAEYTKRMKV